jgi:hypothetical protein
MTYQGTVKNGVVVLETGAPPPEGTRVDVLIRVQSSAEADPNSGEAESCTSWVDAIMKFAGAGKDLPPDLAAEHDHYVHGTPKRSEQPE